MKFLLTLAIIFSYIFFETALAFEQESINLNSRKMKRSKNYLPTQEKQDRLIFEEGEVPGNDGYGFFYKEFTPQKIVCRFKAKVFCDYGLGSIKLIKHKKLQFAFEGLFTKAETDMNGQVDSIISCDASFAKKSVAIQIDDFYVQKVEIKNFPKEIVLDTEQCKKIK